MLATAPFFALPRRKLDARMGCILSVLYPRDWSFVKKCRNKMVDDQCRTEIRWACVRGKVKDGLNNRRRGRKRGDGRTSPCVSKQRVDTYLLTGAEVGGASEMAPTGGPGAVGTAAAMWVTHGEEQMLVSGSK